MALKGTAELHQEFEELRGTNWFQGLLVAAWMLLCSSAFSLYTLLVANRFFSPPMLLVLPNLLLLLLALLLLRIRFHMGRITRQSHAPLRLLRALHQYRPLLTALLIVGVLCTLVLPLHFLSEGQQVYRYRCQVRPSPFDPKSPPGSPYLLFLSCPELQAPPPEFRVRPEVWARFQGGAAVSLETRKGWLGERWLRVPQAVNQP